MKTDENIKLVVVASIRRHSMDMDEWVNTKLWDLGELGVKAELSRLCAMETNELPILYSYIDEKNWMFVTTQRIFYAFKGKTNFIFAKDIIASRYGNFKGYAHQGVEQMQISTKDGELHFCPFETGKASMGAIYAVSTLRQIIEP